MSDGARQSRLFRKISVESLQERGRRFLSSDRIHSLMLSHDYSILGRIVVSDPFRDQLPSIRAQAMNTDCPHTGELAVSQVCIHDRLTDPLSIDTRDGTIHLPSEVGSAKHITWALDSEVSDIPLAELDISGRSASLCFPLLAHDTQCHIFRTRR